MPYLSILRTTWRRISPRSKFQYDTLPGQDYIRLLAFLPPDECDGAICCTLETYKLAEAPEYHALSYCWGDGDADETIVCCERSLKVTKSLKAVLLSMRKHRNGQFSIPNGRDSLSVRTRNLFWVDQICINQNDTTERNHQVRLMRSLYEKASIVLISLGQDFDRLGAPVSDLFTKLAGLDHFNKFWSTRQNGSLLELDKFPTSEEMVEMGLPAFGEDPWLAWEACMRSSYFERVWVVQEVLSAQLGLIISEGGFMSWESWVKGVWWLTLQNKFANTRARTLMPPAITGLCASYKYGPIASVLTRKLHDLVRDVRRLQCKEPKDKIYALAGIATDGEKVAIEYEKLDREVFEDFARYAIGAQKNLDILSDVTHNDQGRGDTPSWVPRWDAPAPRPGLLRSSKFGAACSSEAVLDRQQEPGVLKIKGKQLAMVTPHVLQLDVCDAEYPSDLTRYLWEIISWSVNVGFLNTGEHSSASCIDRYTELAWCLVYGYLYDLQKFSGDTELSASDDGADEQLMHAFRAFIAYNVIASITKRGLEALRCAIQLAQIVFNPDLDLMLAQPENPRPLSPALLQTIEKRQNHFLEDFPDLFKNRESVDELMGRMLRACNGDDALVFAQGADITGAPRSMFITDGGAIGVGPPGLEEGDALCIFYGGSVPYVLRPTSAPDEYTFLGDCYIHRWMNGDAFRKSGEQDKWFRLV